MANSPQKRQSPAPLRLTAGIGQILAERYRILKRVGAGGMGSVFEALDLTTRERVAVKLLRSELRENAGAVARFRREGQILASVHHAAVVRVIEAGELADGTLFLAMELIEGGTLRALMRKGPMTPWRLLPIVRGIVDGLSALHAHGIVHRDLKPSNVVLVRDPEIAPGRTIIQERIKLVDFGVARANEGARLTREGQVVGTLRCMAPEQLRGEPDVDARVDVYALGVLLYEALVGTHPFPGGSADVVPRVLGGDFRAPDTGWTVVDHVILTAMSARREERYATAQQLAAAFSDAAFTAGAIDCPRSRSARPVQEQTTARVSYDAPTVSARHARVPSDVEPMESGTREVATQAPRRARPRPSAPTRMGPHHGRSTRTAFGHALPVRGPSEPAPFEVIPTVSYGDMPIPMPAPRMRPAPPARPRPRARWWIALLALCLGMLAGSGVTAWLVHARRAAVEAPE